MSFGTGHHETTHMMLQHVLDANVKGKSVLDMGCGTGILAILASMKGAGEVHAVDNDHWSFLNAGENIQRNGQEKISVYEGDAGVLKHQKFDYILANINRNILLKDIPRYANHLNSEGYLILSGFYREDLSLISGKCKEVQLHLLKKLEKNNWVAAVYHIS
jgi:ribosomal protein L11 methyltransferase